MARLAIATPLASAFVAACSLPGRLAPLPACADVGPATWKPLATRAGEQVYVEPRAASTALDGSIVLLGAPTYVWSSSTTGSLTSVDESPLGVHLDTDGTVRLISTPPGVDGAIKSIQVAPEAANKWRVVFTRLHRGSQLIGNLQDSAASVWEGVLADTVWESLRRIDAPPGLILDARQVTVLVRTRDGLRFAMLAEAPERRSRVVIFDKRGGLWSNQVLSTNPAAYVALGGAQGDWLAVVAGDAVPGRMDVNSVFVFHHDSGWRALGVRVRGGDEPVHHPIILEHAGVAELSWLVHRHLASGDRRWDVRAQPLHEGQSLEATVVGEGMAFFGAVVGTRGPVWVLSQPGAETLRIVSGGTGAAPSGRELSAPIAAPLAVTPAGTNRLLIAGAPSVRPSQHITQPPATWIARVAEDCRK